MGDVGAGKVEPPHLPYGADKEECGEERLLHTIESMTTAPIPDLLGRIVERSRSFSAKGVFEDDICLVAVQFSGDQ